MATTATVKAYDYGKYKVYGTVLANEKPVQYCDLYDKIFTEEDSKLPEKLSFGDMVAQEVKYHAQCLASFYNRYRAVQSKTTQNNAESKCGIAYAELVAYINEIRETSTNPSVFKLTDFTHMFLIRLDRLIDGLTIYHVFMRHD